MTISLSSPNSSTASIQKNGGDVITFDANNNATFAGNVVTTGTVVSGSAMGMRNRIINGAMMIDQRNAGASTSWTSGTDGYAIDRWGIYNITSVGVFTVQQSSIAPSGFSNSQLITITTADSSLGTTEWAGIEQVIEGTNIYDLGWGTSNAVSVTLSFWVRSSLTGTFGGSLQNNSRNRSYPFTYTISASNTWEQKSITIAGDTTGTWLTTTGRGIRLNIGLGVGSTYSGTAGSWSSNNYYSATGATSVVGTNGATFYITGVQLEVGSVATPFERRLYGQELINCQRYYETGYPVGTAPANGAIGYFDGGSLGATAYASNNMRSIPIQFCVEKRGTPVITLYNIGIGGISANFWAYYNGSAWANYNSASGVSQPTPKCFSVRSSSTSSFGVSYMIEGNWAASAEL